MEEAKTKTLARPLSYLVDEVFLRTFFSSASLDSALNSEMGRKK